MVTRSREMDLSSIAGENVKWYNHSGKLSVTHKTKYALNKNLALAYLDIYIREMKTDVCTKTCTWISHQLSLVTQSCPTLCDPMDYSKPGFPVHHQLPELAQTHVHWADDAIQQSHPLSSPSPPAFNLSQPRGLCQWISSYHQMAKWLELQLQHQSL